MSASAMLMPVLRAAIALTTLAVAATALADSATDKPSVARPAPPPARVLVYQRNGRGFVHDNLAASANALRELGAQNGFAVEVSSNTAVFSPTSLQTYDAVVFANSNNEAFTDDAQRAAFRVFLERGGGFVGIHSSTGSERSWPWFQHMQGAKFLRHSPLQKFTVITLSPIHPATAHFPARWTWTDECYFFTNVNPDIQVLLTVDTTSLRDPKLASSPGETASGVFPLAWCHEQGRSRRFYTSLGHSISHYSDPAFRQHLLGAIRWVLRRTDAPTIPSPAPVGSTSARLPVPIQPSPPPP